MQSGYDYSSLSSASQDNRPFNILREAIFELVQKLFSLQDEKMVMGGCSILKVRAAVNILNTVVSRKYAPPSPFATLALVQNVGGAYTQDATISLAITPSLPTKA